MDSFTKIDNAFLDEVMQNISTHGELACCMVIFRKTIGWGKDSAHISLKTFQELTGFNRKETVISSIRSLQKKGIIKTKKLKGKVTKFSFSDQYGLTVPVRKNRTTGLTVPVPVRMNRTHKRKGKKVFEREKVSFISEEHKMAFILDIMLTEDIKNRQGYEMSMRKKLLQGDKATMEMFDNWKVLYDDKKEFEDFHNSHLGKRINLQTKDKVLTGLVMSISQEGNSFIVALKDGDDYRSAKYRTFDEMKERIEVAA